jgi:hypothetical protein
MAYFLIFSLEYFRYLLAHPLSLLVFARHLVLPATVCWTIYLCITIRAHHRDFERSSEEFASMLKLMAGQQDLQAVSSNVAKLNAILGDLANQITSMKGVMANQSVLEAVSSNVTELNTTVNSLRSALPALGMRIRYLESRFGFLDATNRPSSNDFAYDRSIAWENGEMTTINASGDGLIAKRNKDPFNPGCIVAQSSNNISSLVNPYSADSYEFLGTGSVVCFDFRHAIEITGFRFESASANFVRSFDIVMTPSDGPNITREVPNASLNGAKAVFEIPVAKIEVKSVTIRMRGMNWAGKNRLSLKSFDILTPDEPSGLFAKLFQNSRWTFWRNVTISECDPSSGTCRAIWLGSAYTHQEEDNKNRWVQYSFTSGRVLLNGIRFMTPIQDRSWFQLYGTNNAMHPIEKWTRIECGEIDTVKGIQLFECGEKLPFHTFRLDDTRSRHVWDKVTWAEYHRLDISDVELFGRYFPPRESLEQDRLIGSATRED